MTKCLQVKSRSTSSKSPKILLSKLAHRRYTEHLSARKDNKKAEENSLKRKSIDEEIMLVKKKKQEVEDTIRDLKKDADTLGYEAE